MKNWLLICVAALALTGSAHAATLGISTTDPIGSGTGTLTYDAGVLVLFGDISIGAVQLIGEPVFLIGDTLTYNVELGLLETAFVTDVGWAGSKLEFLIDGSLSSYPGGALLTITSDGLTGLDTLANFSTYFEDVFGGIYFDDTARFSIAAIAPVPLPATLPMLLLGLVGLRVMRRKGYS